MTIAWPTAMKHSPILFNFAAEVLRREQLTLRDPILHPLDSVVVNFVCSTCPRVDCPTIMVKSSWPKAIHKRISAGSLWILSPLLDRTSLRMDNRSMQTDITMRSDNKGLTVKINLFSIEKYIDEFDWQSARLWMRGQATNAATKEVKKFNDAGELITILGKWNGDNYKKLKGEKKSGR